MMDPLIYLVLIGVSLLGLVWLASLAVSQRRRLADLQQRVDSLSNQVSELIQDMGGLCAADVQRDRSALEQEQRLRECIERIETMQVEESGSYPYHGAIELIRKGANALEVAQESGISLSEAELLVRLHKN
jgi:hypothetical protein